MVSVKTWVLLSYRIPREPSTPRIAVWRQLKRLGVAQIGDGLVALPNDPTTKEALEWVANRVIESGGSATIWVATPTVRRFGRELVDQMSHDRAFEYRKLIDRVSALEHVDVGSRTLNAAKAELRRIERRDYFPPPEHSEAKAVIKHLEVRATEELVR